MKADPIRGKTLRWTFSDGPMAAKTFEHAFATDGSVTFRSIDDGGAKGKPSPETHYELTDVGPDVYAVAYLGSSGYTLSITLDFRTGRLAAFASNEKSLVLQHGTFEVLGETDAPRAREHHAAHAH